MALPRFGLDDTFCFQRSAQDASGYAVSIGGVELLAFFCDKCFDTGFKLYAFLVFVPLHTAEPQSWQGQGIPAAMGVEGAMKAQYNCNF